MQTITYQNLIWLRSPISGASMIQHHLSSPSNCLCVCLPLWQTLAWQHLNNTLCWARQALFHLIILITQSSHNLSCKILHSNVDNELTIHSCQDSLLLWIACIHFTLKLFDFYFSCLFLSEKGKICAWQFAENKCNWQFTIRRVTICIQIHNGCIIVQIFTMLLNQNAHKSYHRP